MSKNIAKEVVDALEQAGVKRIYAVTGDSLNYINDAVRRNGNIDWIHVRHEETGAFAAAAEAQLHGNLTCCAGSCGPGHVHLINGVYDAHRSAAPVLVLSSTISSCEVGTQYFQETNSIRLFDDCSYYNEMITTPEQLGRMLQCAMQTAISLKGVGVVGLPGDLTNQSSVSDKSSVTLYSTNPRIIPSPAELTQLADILNDAKKVTLFCGIGAKDAHDELVTLSKLLNAPVAYTFKGKMEIQYDNPHEVGLTGLLGMPSGYDSIEDADILLMLGTDFPYENFLPQKGNVVQIDIRPERLGRRARLKMGLCGDIKHTLEELIPLIRQKEEAGFLNHQLSIYKKVKDNINSVQNILGKENNIQPEYAMSVVNTLAAADAIFTVDTGMTCVWGARYLQASEQRKMLGSFNHGSMANAMPQAIGAALAYPERQVIALCGDGGLSMLLGDMATIVHYNLPVKIIVFNNRSLGMVKLEMEVAGLPDWQTDMYDIDFARIAEGMGMKGYKVSDPEKVYSTLNEALNIKGPVLVDLMTDPEALAMPPKVEFAQMKGFAQSMFRLLMEGRTEEIKNTISSNMRHLKDVF